MSQINSYFAQSTKLFCWIHVVTNPFRQRNSFFYSSCHWNSQRLQWPQVWGKFISGISRVHLEILDLSSALAFNNFLLLMTYIAVELVYILFQEWMEHSRRCVKVCIRTPRRTARNRFSWVLLFLSKRAWSGIGV